MPWDRSRYPDDWDALANQIKTDAKWRCQQCDRPCRMPGESLHDFAQRIEGIPGPDLDWANQTAIAEIFRHPQKFCLTVAHMDQDPRNNDPSNLKALCAPCHCRYDLSQMARKKMLKREHNGQLTLL